jgi:uncharacterized protein (DUF3820 family)
VIDQKHELVALAQMKMPFGKHKGKYLIHLPENYIVWFKQNGFPEGKLGKQLELIYEIKLNGLESLIYPLVPKM